MRLGIKNHRLYPGKQEKVDALVFQYLLHILESWRMYRHTLLLCTFFPCDLCPPLERMLPTFMLNNVSFIKLFHQHTNPLLCMYKIYSCNTYSNTTSSMKLSFITQLRTLSPFSVIPFYFVCPFAIDLYIFSSAFQLFISLYNFCD